MGLLLMIVGWLSLVGIVMLFRAWLGGNLHRASRDRSTAQPRGVIRHTDPWQTRRGMNAATHSISGSHSEARSLLSARSMGVILIVGLAAFFGTSRHGAALGSAGSSIRHSISSTLSFSLPLGSGAQRPVTVTGLHLRNAASIAVDRRGNVFVSEPDSNRIDKLSSGGKLLGRIGAAGAAPGRLDAPAGLATDPRGNIYVGDLGHDRVQELSSSGRPLRLWGTNGQRAGQFSSPSGIALDAQGNIYVTEEDNRRIQKLSPSGKPLAVWGGAQSGEFDTPRGIAVDRHSTIYVGDFGDQSAGSRIEKLSPSGRTLAVWRAGSPSSPDAFYFTGGVAVDGKNRVYAAAGDADRGGLIERWSASGASLSVWRTDDFLPSGIAVDRRGDIFALETEIVGDHSRIVKYSPDGQALAIWE
jgi:sugar lactone lactonase YvrE